ncbi:hypothetical protein RMSM_03802 [Rhodopirellula maiorica SM1]|uniref:Uncharacterized protein n=1 Tax=Rhodopirellula maiorica SM1 TaxID=1265738 RepID=M5RJ94_9BACT|nr:hypothetical protein [Rhodopirellula maiorica]EMI19266.1 hypothetical protein RMSM_03802 [Rhodopirellula maiorica SM1]
MATCVEFFYAPASQGRKAIYLTLASLGFLVLAFFGVLTSSHGSVETSDEAAGDAIVMMAPMPCAEVQRS